MSADLIAIGLQLSREFDNVTHRLFPEGNAPASFAEFAALSSTALNALTLGAAGWTQATTGAAMLAQVQPLTSTLSGISLFSNITADVARVAAAIDSGNQTAINEASLKLILSLTGVLLASEFMLARGAVGLALLGPAGVGYLVGGLVAAALIHIAKDPLVLDLNGDGIALSSLTNSTVHFDYAGDGFAERTGWVSASDGILAIDDNGNGVVDNGLELFGSASQDGFAVLEKLDSNGDGKIDAQDADFNKLKVWQDTNQNGVSDAGELKTLGELGIASISLIRHSVGGTNEGNGVGYEAVFTRDNGTTGIAQTIYFQTDPRQSLSDQTPEFTPAAGVELLPDLAGSGLINSIAYTATNDPDFREALTVLTENAAGLSASELRSAFQALLLQWAGVDAIDAASRGPFVNAQHLAFVEKFFGDTYREIQRNDELRTYPSTSALGQEVEKAFQQLSSTLELGFLAQVGLSAVARGEDPDLAVTSPYFFYSLLDLTVHGSGDPAPDTPANIGAVIDIIAALIPEGSGAAVDYLTKALMGLEGVVTIGFNGDRAAYAATVTPRLSVISDAVVHDIATHIVDGTALFGSIHAEGINGGTTNDVIIGGGGGDVVSGGAGSDIYVYAKHDGNLWIRDDGPGADTDRLVLTDLNAADVSLVRIGDNLLIKATATGNAVTVENFFNGNGIEVLRFADGSELDRTQLKDASVFQGDGHNNVISDTPGDDVIHGAQGDDLIHLGAGNDTLLYGKGDGYDVVTDSSNSASERDTFILTDVNSDDVELSRAGSDLILTVKSTGEYVDFANFYPVGTGDWDITARNIDTIRFADGEAWTRSTIQDKAWYRGTDQIDNIHGSELNDIIHGGKGDDVLEGWTGSDTFIWSKGDGNDQIFDFSSKIGDPDNSDVDTLVLIDVSPGEVSFSYQNNTLLISINSTGEIITVPNFLSGDPKASNEVGIDVIKFKDGETLDRAQIFQLTGSEFLGWDRTVFTQVIAGKIVWQYFIDDFGHAGNIVGNNAPGADSINDVWNASSYGGFGGILGFPDDLQPNPFHGDGNNTLIGNIGNDIMAAGNNDDVLDGAAGDDILWGDFPDENAGGGNDILVGFNGNDALYGGPGMDLLDGGAGADYLRGGPGKDYISGGEGDDIYVGGLGDDVLIGNDAATTGNDTYIYSSGDGSDTIIESGSSAAATETDTLVLTDIDFDHVELSRSGDDLLIRLLGTADVTDVITVVSHFAYRLSGSAANNNAPGNGIEFIEFADIKLDRKQIQEAAWIRGTDGRDILSDNTTNAQLAQTFDAGNGNDVIQAGAGGNTFVYASGDGSDIIFDQTNNNFAPTAIDKLKFSNLNETDVRLERSGNDLMVKIVATGEVITVVSQFANSLAGPDAGLELIQFANGDQWDRGRIQQEAWYRGTDGRDFIQLSGWNDTIEAGKGDDTIYAGYQSASGNDTFVYSHGDGNDFIREETWHSFSATETDVLQLKDINSSDVALSRSGDDLLVKIVSTNETITISHQFSDAADAPGQGLEFIRFADGNEWGRETILGIATSSSPFIAGTNGNDTLIGSSVTQNIYGEAGDDIIDGQGGSDLLYGGQGNDTIKIGVSAAGDLAAVNGGVGTDTLDLGGFAAAAWVDLVTSGAELRTTDHSDLATGSWRDVAQVEQIENVIGTAFADQISGDAGNNVLTGGAGSDVLDGRSGDDTMLGGADNDTLTAGMGADLLDGGDGADTLNGGIGLDTLIGGAGDDVMTGGADRDVFAIGAGSGADTVADFVAGSGSDHDLIRFDRSVFSDYASVLAASAQVGSDVVVTAGGGNTVTLQNVDLSALAAENFEFRRLDNQAPTSISVQGGTVAENAGTGTVVATLSAVDAGDAGTHTYSIVGSEGLFEIIGNEIRVKTGAVVDFEAGSQHALNIAATDDDGLSVTSSISIAITDQTETLTGTSGNDVLTGGAGVDILAGGLGNDRLTGGGGSDEYRYALGDGNDRIIESGNAADVDRLVLGAGIDPSSVVVGRSSRDNADVVLRFTNGATIVLQDQMSNSAGAGLEQIKFDDNTTWSRPDILGRLDDHLIIGGSGSGTLTGSAGADVLVAGTSNETLSGGGGDDIYSVSIGIGHETIVEGYDDAATDRIELAGLNNGDVELYRDGYDLIIEVTATGGTTRVVGQFNYSGSGVEEIVFADATVWDKVTIAENASTRGTSAGETVVGTPGDDVLQPGPGNDLIQAGAGSDTIIYALGDGSDTINDGANSATQVDVLRFVDLNAADVVFSRQGADLTVEVTSSGEVVKVVNQFTSPTDFWGIERVHFADGTVWDQSQISAAAWIRGTSGAETLYGTSDADVIDGRGGDDSLRGGNGGDTYVYKAGSGNDIIYENSGDSGADTVKLVGLTSSDVELSRSGSDLFVRIASSGETLKVDNQFNGSNGIEQITFADNVAWDRVQIADAAPVSGTSGNDTFFGTADAEVFDGKGGNDYLHGGGAGDTYIYGVGSANDTVAETSGDTGTDIVRLAGLNASDVTFSRSNNDLFVQINATSETLKVENQFNGTNGIEQVKFANGSTWDRGQIADAAWIRGTAAAETIWGTSDGEVFDGRGGDDTIYGQGGGDTYVFGIGSGNDTVAESSADTGTDIVKLAGLNSSDVMFSRSNNDLLVQISGGETVKVANQFSGTNGIEQVKFANGSTWDRGQIADAAWIRGTAAAETIWGTSDGEVFDGRGGDDTIYGQGGGDTYVFGIGSGNDTVAESSADTGTDIVKLAGLNSSDVMFSRSNNDLLVQISGGETVKVANQFSGTNGIEQVKFANGSTWDRGQIADAAWIRGTAAAETIWGTADGEVFDGKGGDDTIYGQGGGDTYVFGIGSGNDTVAESSADTGTDIVKLAGLNSSDVMFSRSNNDLLVQITSSGEKVKVANQFSGSNGVEQVAFADGSTWDRAAIFDAAWVRGTAAAETIWGTSDGEVFDGKGGDDTLYGQGGGDTFVFGIGSGNDTVAESSADTGTDIVKLAGLNSSDVMFSRSNNDLLVQIISSGETVKVANQFSGTNGIEQVKFANGSTWDRSQIADAAWVRGTTGNDTFFGSNDAEVFDGKGGNDYLHGGGSGDTYIYRVGSGNDTVAETSGDTGDDVAKLVGLNSSDVEFSRNGNDLFIRINSSSETLKVENQFNGSNGIEQVAFADGSTWNRAAIADAAWVRGTSGNDSFYGSNDAEVFDGKGGNDYLHGGGGGDTYLFGAGSGNDTVAETSGDTGNDVAKLVGLNSSDVEFSRNGNDLFIRINSSSETLKVENQFNGGNGIEQVAFADGSAWNRAAIADAAWVRGTSGNDSFYGSNDAEVFDGKGGNDYLHGGGGGDTYLFGAGSGNDTVAESSGDSGSDVIKLMDLTSSDVLFSHSGNDLLIQINATGETLKVENQFSGSNGVEGIVFADGTAWDRSQIDAASWFRGTSGNDTISGTSGNDTIAGGQGNDTLSGAAGDDTFVFRASLGQDIVTDFTPGHDVLEFRDGIFADAAAALAAASASGSHTIITIDATTTVLLQNVALANLHAADFHIV
jgi:Ca2+-binding RTX toxin-like protein